MDEEEYGAEEEGEVDPAFAAATNGDEATAEDAAMAGVEENEENGANGVEEDEMSEEGSVDIEARAKTRTRTRRRWRAKLPTANRWTSTWSRSQPAQPTGRSRRGHILSGRPRSHTGR